MSLDLHTSLSHIIQHGEAYAPLYGCSEKSTEEWYATGSAEPAIGIYFITSAVIMEVIYCLCLFGMVKKKLLQFPCYKLLFCKGIIDMVALIVLSVSTGYYSIVGAVFCTDPLAIFVAAAVLSGCWCMCSFLSVLIAFNRCAEISQNSFFKSQFERYTLHMILLCLIYSVFIALFTTPGLFNSKFVAWFYNPQIGREDRNYVNIYHIVNNFVTVSTTILLYIYLCGKLCMQTNLSSTKLTRFESELAFIFIYAQYFPSPRWLVITGTVSHQLCCGISGIIYIFVNRSIRSAIVELVARKNIVTQFNAPQSRSWPSKTT